MSVIWVGASRQRALLSPGMTARCPRSRVLSHRILPESEVFPRRGIPNSEAVQPGDLEAEPTAIIESRRASNLLFAWLSQLQVSSKGVE